MRGAVLVGAAAILAGSIAPRVARADSAIDDATAAPEEEREGHGEIIHGAKGLGVHTPRGRTLYREGETFETVVDSRRRIFVMEAAAGYGPEGNLGLVLGWLPKALHGVEFYGGVGVEVNPAWHASGAVRFLFSVHGFRPYIGAGYFYKDLFVTKVYAHNAFVEVGHSWKLGPTYHLTIGIGLARLLSVGVRKDSPLRTAEVNPAGLGEQLDGVAPYRPTIALRFSRAF